MHVHALAVTCIYPHITIDRHLYTWLHICHTTVCMNRGKQSSGSSEGLHDVLKGSSFPSCLSQDDWVPPWSSPACIYQVFISQMLPMWSCGGTLFCQRVLLWDSISVTCPSQPPSKHFCWQILTQGYSYVGFLRGLLVPASKPPSPFKREPHSGSKLTGWPRSYFQSIDGCLASFMHVCFRSRKFIC